MQILVHYLNKVWHVSDKIQTFLKHSIYNVCISNLTPRASAIFDFSCKAIEGRLSLCNWNFSNLEEVWISDEKYVALKMFPMTLHKSKSFCNFWNYLFWNSMLFFKSSKKYDGSDRNFAFFIYIMKFPIFYTFSSREIFLNTFCI